MAHPPSESATPTVLITGGSGGIGLALAERFAADSYRVVLVARRSPRLTKAAAGLRKSGADVLAAPADLAAPGAAGKLKRRLDRRQVHIDILINNAGFGLAGPFVATSPKRERELLALNISALVELCKLYAPELVARKSGRIMNVASVAAFLPGPLMASYYASKAFVRSFSWALAEELEPMGVSVTCLCPGPTQTGFAATARAGQSAMFKGGGGARVDRVADAGYRGLLRGKREVVPGLTSRLGTWLLRILPTRAAARIALRADS